MPYPDKPNIQTSYTAYEQSLGDGSLPGQELDNDFANLADSVESLNDFVRGVTRSDGALRNGIVTRDSLSTAVLVDLGASDPVGAVYSTRAEFVAANSLNPGLTRQDGYVLTAAGIEYARLAASTIIPDIPGWVPNGDPNPAHFGVTDVLRVPYEIVGSGGMSACPALRTKTRPRVELGIGQSNMARQDFGFSWAPAPNLRGWNYWGSSLSDAAATTHVGTMQAPGTNFVNFLQAFGDRIARREVDTPVFVASIAKGGISIAQYLDGAANPAMMTALRNNVPAWLTAIRNETGWTISHVDRVHFWQGETDFSGSLLLWRGRVEAVIAQMDAETWMAPNTPVIFYGSSPFGSNWQAGLTPIIMRMVAKDPGRFSFVDHSDIPISLWDSNPAIDYVHLTPVGYFLAGQRDADAVETSAVVRGAERVSYDKTADALVFGSQDSAASWDFHFSKVKPAGNTTAAIDNSDGTGNAQLRFRAGPNQMDMTAFGTGGGRIRSEGTGSFTINTAGAGPVILGANGSNNQVRVLPTGQTVFGGSSVASGSAVEVISTTGGFMLPRMTTAERDAIASPANGLLIYNSTTQQFEGRRGGAWVTL